MGDGPHWSEEFRQKRLKEAAEMERKVKALREASYRLWMTLDRVSYRPETSGLLRELYLERSAVEEALKAFPGGLHGLTEGGANTSIPLMKETEEETKEET